VHADTGIAVDLAILAVPALACPEAMRDAARAGCGGALIVGGGFGETGEAGEQLQQKIAAICREYGIRLLGPNTAGFFRPSIRCAASFVSGDAFVPGDIAVVAQSGGVNLTLSFLVHRLGLGLSLALGLGNAIDVDAADALDYLAGDIATNGIALHLEGVRDGRKLYEAIRRITPDKPVVAVVAGRSDVGAFAQSHTGNLIGSWERKVAALRQAGAIVVAGTEEAADAVAVLSRSRIAPKPDPGIGVLTGQAGPGLLVVDAIKYAGVSVPGLSGATVEKIAALLPPLTYMRNPVDTGRPGPSFPEVAKALAADPAIDAVALYAIHEPAAIDPVAVLRAVQHARGKPFVFGTAGMPADLATTLTALTAIGVPVLGSPERLALAAVVLAQDAKAQFRLRRAPLAAAPAHVTLPVGTGIDEVAAKALLRRYGIATPASVACNTHAQARAAFAALRRPIVAKILSTDIAHKTEAGGVRLNIATEAALDAALAALDAIPLDGERRYLIEEMAAAGVELIAGAVRDPSFGPVVMVGLGGIAAEAMRDSAVRLAPITEIDALEMMDELRGKALLEGFRGAPAVDRGAVASALVAVSRLMLDAPWIAEIDINPLRAGPQGAIALDALIVTRST
jgi:acetyltransferase